MKTEQELKAQCTPEIIKKMCELAEGFEFEGKLCYRFGEYVVNTLDKVYLPLLIHRAVDGWNNKCNIYNESIVIDADHIVNRWIEFYYDEYQPETLTHSECAILDCLLEVLK